MLNKYLFKMLIMKLTLQKKTLKKFQKKISEKSGNVRNVRKPSEKTSFEWRV